MTDIIKTTMLSNPKNIAARKYGAGPYCPGMMFTSFLLPFMCRVSYSACDLVRNLTYQLYFQIKKARCAVPLQKNLLTSQTVGGGGTRAACRRRSSAVGPCRSSASMTRPICRGPYPERQIWASPWEISGTTSQPPS